ncbi:MAG: mechanosensitive ion channel family protein [Hyphomicrobiaceae bacterium]
MESATAKLGIWVEGFWSVLPNLIVAVVVITMFVALALVLRIVTRRTFRRRGREDLGEMLADFVMWSMILVGLLIGLTIVLPTLNPGDLVAGLGVGSVAIGFAFKDILQNWLAGLLILLRQPFRRGDQISLGTIEGTVQRIEQRATLIKTYDGRVVVVPNADIYTQCITINTAHEQRRISIDVTVGYEHSVRSVQALINSALARVDEIKPTPAPQVLPWALGPTSLALKVRFWIESHRAAEVAAHARAVQAIKEAFQAHGIDPSDPQIVFTSRIEKPLDHYDAAQQAEAHPGTHDQQAPSPPPRVLAGVDDPEDERPRENRCGTTL